VTAPVELEEDGNGDNDNNNDDDHDNSQQEQTTTRSGRVVVPRVRFDDIDWQEYDATARQNLSSKQLVQQVIRDNSDDNSDAGEEFLTLSRKSSSKAISKPRRMTTRKLWKMLKTRTRNLQLSVPVLAVVS
jgi:hypothetical protein